MLPAQLLHTDACCYAFPQARGTGSVARSFPSLLLQELAGVMVHWQPQQRLLAHALLLLLLPAASEGLREQQASMLLSVAWHEAVLPSNAPAAFVALDRTLAALLGAAPAAALPQAVKMLAALQQEVVAAGAAVPNGAAALASDSGRRMAALSAAQACALLCVCASALRTLAVQLGQPALEQLAVPGCGEALPRLGVGQQAGGGAEPAEAVGTQAGVQQQETWQQFWQAPAAVHEFSPGGAAAGSRLLGVLAAEQQRAGAAGGAGGGAGRGTAVQAGRRCRRRPLPADSAVGAAAAHDAGVHRLV